MYVTRGTRCTQWLSKGLVVCIVYWLLIFSASRANLNRKDLVLIGWTFHLPYINKRKYIFLIHKTYTRALALLFKPTAVIHSRCFRLYHISISFSCRRWPVVQANLKTVHYAQGRTILCGVFGMEGDTRTTWKWIYRSYNRQTSQQTLITASPHDDKSY